MKRFTPFTRLLEVVFGMAAFGVALAATDSPGKGVCPGGSTSMRMGPLSGRGLPLFLKAGARDRRNQSQRNKSRDASSSSICTVTRRNRIRTYQGIRTMLNLVLKYF